MISKILLSYTDILDGLIFDTVYESLILSLVLFTLDDMLFNETLQYFHNKSH